MGDDQTTNATVDASRARPGEVITGKFRVLREIGRGGMGVVYEAEDISLRRTIALKFLSADPARNPHARRRFIQEAQAASALDHPNICTIHEVGETAAGEMFIAMARYRGESLKEKIQRAPIPVAEVLDLAVQVAEGLAKAHEHGIVHRDLKPGNVFVTEDGTAKVLDFGLAKLADQEAATVTGAVLGTPAYMSPEQVRGGKVDARSDVWALGVVLYEMVTGQLPFQREDTTAVFHAIVSEPPRPARQLRPGFPAGIQAVIARALAKDPGGRFASAREMADALVALREQAGSPGSRPARRLTFRRRGRRVLAIAAALVLCLSAAGLGYWFLNRPLLAFADRDRLMVADAENETGDKVFDLALRTAIEADLQQSPYAIVFDRPQIADTLRLMRKDPGTRVDEAIAYDVCRFAGVRAFVLPRILAAGRAYELEAILVDPVRRRHVDRIRVTAASREDVLLHAVDELAGQVRSRLGESLGSIQKADRPVAQVTTSSWDALNYFSMAQARWQASRFKEAGALFELALENDPQFVSARGSLGLLYCQFLDDRARGKEMLRRALRDAESQRLPKRDQLHLRAVNRQFVDDDLPGALEEYRMMRELFPEFMPPWNNSGMILRSLGRDAEAVTMFEKASALAPRNSVPLTNLWFTQINRLHDARAAEGAARRLVALAPNLAGSHATLGFTLAAEGRYAEAEQELRRTLEIEPRHAYAMPNLAHALLASGRPADAEPIYREMFALAKQGQTTGSAPGDAFALAYALQQSGKADEARAVAVEGRDILLARLKGKAPAVLDLVMMGALAAAAGDAAAASKYLDRARARGTKDAGTLVDLAELEAVLGQKAAAIGTLRTAYAAGYNDYFFPMLIPGFRSVRDDPEFRALLKLPR